jgi:hypothetical protein
MAGSMVSTTTLSGLAEARLHNKFGPGEVAAPTTNEGRRADDIAELPPISVQRGAY